MFTLESTENPQDYFTDGVLFHLGEYFASKQSTSIFQISIFMFCFCALLFFTFALFVAVLKGHKENKKSFIAVTITTGILIPVTLLAGAFFSELSDSIKAEYNQGLMVESNRNIAERILKEKGLDIKDAEVIEESTIKVKGNKGVYKNVPILQFTKDPITATDSKGNTRNIVVSGTTDRKDISVATVY